MKAKPKKATVETNYDAKGNKTVGPSVSHKVNKTKFHMQNKSEGKLY